MHGAVVASLVLVLGGLISQGTAQAPIPLRPPGFFYSNGSCVAPIQLEAFVDLMCPNSKAAWPTYQKVADYYGPNTVRFSALIFPLPYHRAAMVAAQVNYDSHTLISVCLVSKISSPDTSTLTERSA